MDLASDSPPECDSILSAKDVDKIMYYSDCIFTKNIDKGIRMYVSRLYIQLHSDKSKIDKERIKLFKIFCQIIVKIDAISSKNDVKNESNIIEEVEPLNQECNDIFEIKCNFQIPKDILMNKESTRELTEDDFSSISGFYQSNTANVYITFDMFVSTLMCNNFKDLILLFNSLLMNGRFDVVEIIISEFHNANEHSICKAANENWLSLLNSFIPTANTQHIINCIKFLIGNKCNKACICYCKLVRWILVRSWALISATGAGFSIVLLFIKEMITFVERETLSVCGNCDFDSAHAKLESMAKFLKQYIYYINKASDYIGIFEYMEIQTCTIIHRILKSSYTGRRIDPCGCKNCDSGFIYEVDKCNICFDCAHTGLTTIYSLLESFLSSNEIENTIAIDNSIISYSPMWICITNRNMESLKAFSKGINCDAKLIVSELLSLSDEVPFLCDLIIVILTYSLDCIDVYNLVLKIESIYTKLLVKNHSNWLQKIPYILGKKNDISHNKCHCLEVKRAMEKFSGDCDIALLVANNLDFEANLRISDIRDATELDGLYRLVRMVVDNIDYAGHETVSSFIKLFCSKMAGYSGVRYNFLIALFISVTYSHEDFKPVYTLLMFELSEESDFIAKFFYYITNPGVFLYKSNGISSTPTELQKYTFFKYLLENPEQCDPRNSITWSLDLKLLDDKTIDSIRLQHSLLSSLISICKWINFDKYPYLHYLHTRINGVIEVYELGKTSGFTNSEGTCKFDFPSDIEGLSFEALVILTTTLQYSSAIDGILTRLGVDSHQDLKSHMFSNVNDYSGGEETPEHVSRCVDYSGLDINSLSTIVEPSVALKLAEKMWFEKENIYEDCIWWFSGDSVDYSTAVDDNQILSELRCTIQDSFAVNSYRNLFDSVLNPKSDIKSMDYYDVKCIKFLRIWSYDPEWAFLSLISSKDWKYVFRKLVKYKPFVENKQGLFSEFFSLCETHLSMDDQRQLKNIFEFSKILQSIDGNLTRIVGDAKYRRDVLKSMPLDFIQAFYSSLITIYCPPFQDLQDVDLSNIQLDGFIDIIHNSISPDSLEAKPLASNLSLEAKPLSREKPLTSYKSANIHELNVECAQVMLDNLNLEQVSNPLVRMRLLLYPDRLISELVRLNNRLTNGSNFRFLWFTLRKLLAQALELHSTHVDIHGCESINYLHFIQALLYIMPEFDLYLLHRASITNGNSRWDPVKQHLAKITNRVSICAIKSLLEVTDDSVKKLLIWLKLPNL